MGMCKSQHTKFGRWLISLQSFRREKLRKRARGEHKLDYDREIPVCIRISSSKEVEPALPKPMYSSWKNFFSLNLVIFTLF